MQRLKEVVAQTETVNRFGDVMKPIEGPLSCAPHDSVVRAAQAHV